MSFYRCYTHTLLTPTQTSEFQCQWEHDLKINKKEPLKMWNKGLFSFDLLVKHNTVFLYSRYVSTFDSYDLNEPSQSFMNIICSGCTLETCLWHVLMALYPLYRIPQTGHFTIFSPWIWVSFICRLVEFLWVNVFLHTRHSYSPDFNWTQWASISEAGPKN